MGEMRNVYKIVVGKPEEKRALGRPRRKMENNIKIALKVTGFEGVKWSHVTKDNGKWWAPFNTAMNLRVLDQMSDY